MGWIIQLNKLFMKTIIFTSFIIMGISGLMAQLDCDPSLAPQNLQSIYTPGVGAQLSWDVVPGSQGVQLKVDQTFQNGSLALNVISFWYPIWHLAQERIAGEYRRHVAPFSHTH